MKSFSTLMMVVFIGCGVFGPSDEVRLTARVLSDTVIDDRFNEVTFFATSSPADTMYYHIIWVDRGGQIIEVGKDIPDVFDEESELKTSIIYRTRSQLQLDFMVFGPKSDTVRITFIN